MFAAAAFDSFAGAGGGIQAFGRFGGFGNVSDVIFVFVIEVGKYSRRMGETKLWRWNENIGRAEQYEAREQLQLKERK